MKPPLFTKRCVFCAVSLLLVACGGYTLVRVDESEKEKVRREGIERSLSELEVDQNSLRQRMEEGFDRTADQQKRMEQRLENMEKSLGEEAGRLRRRLADFGNGLEQLKVELVTLQGRIDKEGHRVTLLTQKLEDHSVRLSTLSAELMKERDQREGTIRELSTREATLSTRVETLATDLRDLSRSLHNSSEKLASLSSALDNFQKASAAQINELTKGVAQFSRIVESLGVKMAAEIAEQNKRIDEQEKKVAELDRVSLLVTEHGQKTADLSQRFEEFQKASAAQINELIQAVRTLSTTMSDLGTQMATQVDGQAQILDRTVKRLESVEAKLGVGKKPATLSGGAVPSPSPPPETEQQKPPVKGNPQEVFDQAYAEFERGEHERALGAFRNFTRRFPDSELVADANYFIGEIYFIQMEFPKAIDAYEKVITGHPASKRVVSALLKEGFAYAELQQVGKARTTLKRIIELYPHTAEATQAKEKLAGLR